MSGMEPLRPPAETAPPVLTERRGRLGLITLNRPGAINALTHEMVGLISNALDAWRDDPEIATVAVDGVGDRGLCAGGDVVSLYEDARQGDGTASAAFWRDEYAMNAAIASYPKPYVALQRGLVLGGGIGVSTHGSHRVVSETSRLGFPEVTIGYIPDVGASWLLSRAPGELGTRIALTAESVSAADAILLGLADVFVAADRIEGLLAALETEDVDDAIARFSQDPPPGRFEHERTWTDAAFAADTVPEILAALRALGDDDADTLAATIDEKSPTALAVTLESLRRARDLPDLEAALRTEFRVSMHALRTHDFAEGIRAQLIERDRNPRWVPAAHTDVTPEIIGAYFVEGEKTS